MVSVALAGGLIRCVISSGVKEAITLLVASCLGADSTEKANSSQQADEEVHGDTKKTKNSSSGAGRF